MEMKLTESFESSITGRALTFLLLVILSDA